MAQPGQGTRIKQLGVNLGFSGRLRLFFALACEYNRDHYQKFRAQNKYCEHYIDFFDECNWQAIKNQTIIYLISHYCLLLHIRSIQNQFSNAANIFCVYTIYVVLYISLTHYLCFVENLKKNDCLTPFSKQLEKGILLSLGLVGKLAGVHFRKFSGIDHKPSIE